MKLPFKPPLLALLCSAGLLAASGVLYVKSQTPAAAPAVSQPVPAQTPPPPVAPVATAYTTAQIDQWVAPVALYPDALLSQVLMASTYPANVVQAAQWSRDNPSLQGDQAIQAVANQPWDPSVKSLVAFPPLMALMSENPQWVEDLGNAFLAQPQDVMNAVQKLRALAQQTGALQSNQQQTVTQIPKTTAVASTTQTTSAGKTTVVSSAPTETVIKIEPADPQVVYVPSYNPATVYGTWPNASYPPVYLPPPPGQQFTDSFVRGFGFSLGVATTYALFSNIDWDDDDDHHHHHDYDHGGYYHNGNNININVDNFNRISGEHLTGGDRVWTHNPAFRDNVPYRNDAVASRFHQTTVPGGLSATQSTPATRDSQRQAAMQKLQQANGHLNAVPATRDAQRQAASKQLNQIAQRNNFRGYDSVNNDARREVAKQHLKNPTAQQQQRRDAAKNELAQPGAQLQQRREAVQQHHATLTPEQRQQRRETFNANALSGNDSRSPSWQAQQQRGLQSRKLATADREHLSHAHENAPRHHEFHRR